MRRNLSYNPPDTEDCLFHCQQSAEKALKAVLTWFDEPFRKTHDLEELARVCCRLAPALADSMGGLAPLTRYAWEYRYPGENVPPSADGSREWVDRVAALLLAVEAELPEEKGSSGPLWD